MQIGFNITLDSHHNNFANSNLTIEPNFSDFGIEFRYSNKIFKEMAIIYAGIIKQYNFIYHTKTSARFDKQNEEGQKLDENNLFINLNIIHNLTELDIDNIDIISPLEHPIQ